PLRFPVPRLLRTASSAIARAALFRMPLQPQFEEARNQIGIANTCGLPQLWIHADLGESRERIHLVEENATLAVRLHQKIDAGEAGEIAGPKGGKGHLPNLFRFDARNLGWNHRHRAFRKILGLVVVELLARNDLAHHARLWVVVPEHTNFQFACPGLLAAHAMLDNQLAI